MPSLETIAEKLHHFGWNGVDPLPSQYTVDRVRSEFPGQSNILDPYFYWKVEFTKDRIVWTDACYQIMSSCMKYMKEETLPDGRIMIHGMLGMAPAALIPSREFQEKARLHLASHTMYHMAFTASLMGLQWKYEDFTIFTAISKPAVQVAGVRTFLELHRGKDYSDLLEMVQKIPAEDIDDRIK